MNLSDVRTKLPFLYRAAEVIADDSCATLVDAFVVDDDDAIIANTVLGRTDGKSVNDYKEQIIAYARTQSWWADEDRTSWWMNDLGMYDGVASDDALETCVCSEETLMEGILRAIANEQEAEVVRNITYAIFEGRDMNGIGAMSWSCDVAMGAESEEKSTAFCTYKDVAEAARELQYTIRWFFHVYTMHHSRQERWIYDVWRHKVIMPWDFWPRPVRLWKYLTKANFIRDTVRGIRFLIRLWWN